MQYMMGAALDKLLFVGIPTRAVLFFLLVVELKS
jgi:hypothetical protein